MGSLPKDFKSFASADFAILAYLYIYIQFLCNAKDFKSLASADSATRAYLFIFYRFYTIRGILSPLCLPIPPHKHGFYRWLSVNLYSTDRLSTHTPQKHTAERNGAQNLLNAKKTAYICRYSACLEYHF